MGARTEKLLNTLLNGGTLEGYESTSRAEAYLKACIEGSGVEGLPTPVSRLDALLYRLAAQIATGGVTVGGKLAGIVDRTVTEITADDLAGVNTIGNYAFCGCGNLKKAEVPAGITSIGAYAFNGCWYLSDVQLPNTVKTIGRYSFNGCRNLAELVIPASVESIGAHALAIMYEASASVFKFLRPTPPAIEATTFNTAGMSRIIVPAGCGEAYKTAENWSTFADYIEEATA